jgi:predicted RNA-binding protein with PUA-like domain
MTRFAAAPAKRSGTSPSRWPEYSTLFTLHKFGVAMAFWIFKCNPEKYRLGERLADPNPILTWTVSRFREEIQAGDTVFLWLTGSKRAIRDVIRVVASPRLMSELESEQAFWVERDNQEQFRVVGEFTHRDVNLSHTQLREIKGLSNLSVFTGFQQATNFPVTPAEGEILLNMIKNHPNEHEA